MKQIIKNKKLYTISNIKYIEIFSEYFKNKLNLEKLKNLKLSGANEIASNNLYKRAASIFKKLCNNKPLGSLKLSRIYGKLKNRGVKPDKKINASKKIIRVILKELRENEYIVFIKNKGNIVSEKGLKLINELII